MADHALECLVGHIVIKMRRAGSDWSVGELLAMMFGEAAAGYDVFSNSFVVRLRE